MASSDDEEELVPQSVKDYSFVDAKEEPISFSVLPLQFDDTGNTDAPTEQVFLHGTGDDGLQKVYKQVIAWKLGLEDAQPEVMVCTKDSKWIKLLKPRKSYEGSIRTILITIQLLHFLKRKPESPEKSLWEHLWKIFSTFEERPSVNDLKDHYELIRLLTSRDDALAKSEMLLMLSKEGPKNKPFGVDLQSNLDTKKSFIVDDLEEDMANEDGDESEEEPDLFDSVCAICDNGGEILCCEGRCMRSFHATKKDGEDSECRSLGFNKAQVEAIQNFLCPNCKYKQHQCFICGNLGCSDKSKGAEVFSCVNATCGHFYHPKCVADLLFQENKTAAAEYEKKIADGESFTCPVHKCHVCKQGENKEVKELQFAVCRRCPKSYHRKCLPRKIAFDDIEEEDILQRAWEDLLPSRILIYCLKHKIDEDLGTPKRNHIKFPETTERKKVVDVQKSKMMNLLKRKQQISSDLPRVRPSLKPKKATEKVHDLEEVQHASSSGRIAQQVANFQKQLKPSKVTTELVHKYDDLAPLGSKKPLKGRANDAVSTISSKIVISSYPKITGETEKKLLAFVEDTTSSLTLQDVLKKRTVPSTYSHNPRNTDRSLTLGKIEGSVEAVKTALEKLEAGGKVEDAKAVCEPNVIKQIMRWNKKLKVYLAPFLHGMLYTSFGRHFTKVDKLQRIVDKLQWYVQNGDTIVDFCCGANDFSRLMKEKLDSAGKKCSYKNFDIIQPKYDFNFEKRDWLSVQPNELPTGSQLIMGLNPPFGVNAALANKFIDKALTFNPKLIVLIVPSETERLDRKRSPYDLIWEDNEELSGKSFYFPGSVDTNDKIIEQWNNKVPPLYLWSRSDWTSKHKDIALKQGHLSNVRRDRPVEDVHREPHVEEEAQERKSDVLPPKEGASGRPEDKEATTAELTAREGNQKISQESRKRSPPENGQSRGARKKIRRKMIQEGKEKAKMREEAKQTGHDEAKGQTGHDEAKGRKREAAAGNEADHESDMSISPPRTTRESSRDRLMGQHPLETVGTPREPFRISAERPSDLNTGLPFVPNSAVGDDIADIARRYSTLANRDGLFSGGSHGWSGERLGGLTSEERFPGYNGLDPLSRRPYSDNYGRPLDAQPRPYRDDDYLQRTMYPPPMGGPALGPGDVFPPPSYGPPGSMQGSVMQRFAPQLDELNQPRGPPGVRRDMPPDSFGFGPGPQHPY